MEVFELQDFFKRINLNTELKVISENICRDYNLGKYVSEELIAIGYEDFNFILNTTLNKYCVKIFSKDRTMQEITDYIDRMEKVNNIGINFPPIITLDGKTLYELIIKDVTYRICVFEYVNRQELFRVTYKTNN